MATINTGIAFFQKLEITITTGGTPQVVPYYITDPIPNTSYGYISESDFALLSQTDAQARYDAFQGYLFTLYPGFSAADIVNQPINTDTVNCPI
jgi:hypothetical protein